MEKLQLVLASDVVNDRFVAEIHAQGKILAEVEKLKSGEFILAFDNAEVNANEFIALIHKAMQEL